jgi:hypothetical protein
VDAKSLGIPTLDLAWQASCVPEPVYVWGSRSRRLHNPGTYHFYSYDYLFTGLTAREDSWRGPVDSGALVLVEANFSSYDGLPVAEAIWATYRKRTLARKWQEAGVPIMVDLNVGFDRTLREVNLFGVPRGWRSYATRSHRGVGLEGLALDHGVAAEHAGTDDVVFAVFGGGKKVRGHCADQGWIWVPEHSDVVRGRPRRVLGNGQDLRSREEIRIVQEGPQGEETVGRLDPPGERVQGPVRG